MEKLLDGELIQCSIPDEIDVVAMENQSKAPRNLIVLYQSFYCVKSRDVEGWRNVVHRQILIARHERESVTRCHILAERAREIHESFS